MGYIKKPWIKEGLYFGAFLFVMNSLLFPLLFEDMDFTLKRVLVGLLVFMIAGLGYGYSTRILFPKWLKKSRKSNQ